jgi:hypothetical protein
MSDLAVFVICLCGFFMAVVCLKAIIAYEDIQHHKIEAENRHDEVVE